MTKLFLSQNLAPGVMFSIIIGYLAGSIPFAYLVAKISKRVDIRKVGSKNPGATNVYRSVGKIHGIIALALDASKGAAAVLIISKIYGHHSSIYPVLAGLSAILGHTYTLFLGFKGGKGVATGLGVFAALAPLGVIVGAIIFTIVYGSTRYVSAGSIVAAIAVIITTYLVGYPLPVKAGATIAGLLIILRHKSNIIRLLTNTETKTNL